MVVVVAVAPQEAEMPEGWLEDAERFIPDPSSSRPEDWDDEEDGQWEPVMVRARDRQVVSCILHPHGSFLLLP